MVRHRNYICFEEKCEIKKEDNDQIQIRLNCCQATKNGRRFVPPQSSAAAIELKKNHKRVEKQVGFASKSLYFSQNTLFFFFLLGGCADAEKT